MPLRVGINGFGRIGRQVFKIGLRNPKLDFVAINDVAEPRVLSYLLKYDSIFGKFGGAVTYDRSSMFVDGKEIRVFSQRDPSAIPWDELGVDLVVESSGVFTGRDEAAKHLRGSVKKVVITAPSKGESADYTVVMGVNEEGIDVKKHYVISNSSCTTNAFAIMVKVLHERFGVRRGVMTTVHAYTNDQRILDAPHSDLRRARAAAISVIPTSTGAAKTIELIFPELKGRLSAIALRVPTFDVSVVDFAAELKRNVSVEEVNKAFEEEAKGRLAKYLEIAEDPIVSIDLVGDEHSVVFDPSLTQVVDGNLVKVFGWYDNEWGYSARVVDLIDYLRERMGIS
ncbi:MAG: type I glyceraldehyde-3-phosphate dehydrogenase [Candidatus Korarchaeum sp.]|nr:type I glyceraldehyde-3-phosphate dehydrogenase [Candidatus Korarchaeum sp.]MDW8035265.1 type I glyceraldehyde-3-phosphate dehydrogenase [Candidatus Korarchaeum sp.]